ncbi:unnamed protein product, partial [Ranitomeya imitator]
MVPSVEPPAPVLVEGELEYFVEKILDSRVSRRKLQYLVKWKGYAQEDNSWVFASDVHASDLVRAFHAAHPGRPGGSACLCFAGSSETQRVYRRAVSSARAIEGFNSTDYTVVEQGEIFFKDTTQKEKDNEQESVQSEPQETTDLSGREDMRDGGKIISSDLSTLSLRKREEKKEDMADRHSRILESREVTSEPESDQQDAFKSTNSFKSSRARVISIEEDPIQECLLKHFKLLQEGITEEVPTGDFFSTTETGDSGHSHLTESESPALDGYTKKEQSSISFEINKTSHRDVKKIDLVSKMKSIQQDFDVENKNTSEISNFHEKVEHKSKIPNHFQEFHSDPDHVYKIMFVGNTHVGKTSFLCQVHEGSYSKNTSATIGIDYRIKSLIVDNKQYALQLWDTAGQERFYSITEQFFRKADGMVIMYDVTSRETFTGVRRWLNCIQEKAMDDIIILLLGNKLDCDSERQVTFDDGQRLAQEHKLLFTECSAASGKNITEALIQIVRSLREHEENMKNNVVTLKRSETLKKTNCCT